MKGSCNFFINLILTYPLEKKKKNDLSKAELYLKRIIRRKKKKMKRLTGISTICYKRLG